MTTTTPGESSKLSGQHRKLSELALSETSLTLDISAIGENFASSKDAVRHTLTTGALDIQAAMPAAPGSQDDSKGAWWSSYLRGAAPKAERPLQETLRYVDLFSGPGGLALGLRQLALELGVSLVPELIVDVDERATEVYAANHGARARLGKSVEAIVDYGIRRGTDTTEFTYLPELIDSTLDSRLGDVDVVLAGPPCQGHSNLNNHTRRDDPRNDLYLTVPAFAVAIGAPVCIVENVPAILNDADDVVTQARQLFESAGYHVTAGMLSASSMGWPQTRKRHFLVARRDAEPLGLDVVASALSEPEPRSVWWAIADLEDVDSGRLLDQWTELSQENVERVAWLFENDAYDLGLPERPTSHRNGTSYQAVYGRLHKDKPAQTITTGFMSPGRGRYVHPTRPRVLTAHEAARLQGFPDTYVFVPDPKNPPSRANLAKWIGDAVPMPLGYAAALSALGYGLPRAGRLD